MLRRLATWHFAVEWEILTTEEDPRAILAYPW
jgi:hypothetical protein